MRKKDIIEVDIDVLDEIKEILEHAIEDRRWSDVDEALELLDDVLGVKHHTTDEEDEE